MKWFLDLTTRGKLSTGFGAMIVFLIAVIATAYTGITAIQASQKNLYQEDFANALDLMRIRAHENGVRAALFSMMAAAQRSEQETWHQEIKERTREIAAITQRLLQRNRGDPHFIGKLEELKTFRDAFAQTRDTQLLPLIYAGKAEQARALGSGVQEERHVKIRMIADGLGNEAEAAAQNLHELGQKLQQLISQYRV